METFTEGLNELIGWLAISSLKSLPLIAIVLLLQYALRKYLSANARHSLWLIVFVCLSIPFGWRFTLNSSHQSEYFTYEASTSSTQQAVSPEYINPNIEISSAQETVPPINVNHSPLNIYNLLGYSWATIFFGLVLITLWQIGRFNRIKKSATLANENQEKQLNTAKNTLNLNKRIPLLYSPRIQSPLTFGLFKPVIILPADIEQQLTQSQLNHVLLHELAHIQRNDILWNWLAYWAVLLHWFNPLVWYASKRMKADMEIACDAKVLMHLSPQGKNDYGLTLIKVSQLPFQPISEPRRFSHSLGILENHRELKNRLIMIKEFTAMTLKKSLLFTLVFSTLTVAALAQPEQKKSASTGHISADDSITLQQFAAKAEQDLKTKILIGINSDSRIQANVGKSPISYEQLLTQLQINGFTAFKTKDYIQILSVRDARTLAPIAEEGKTYFDDEFITDYIKLEKACAESVLAAVRPLVPSYGFLSTYNDARTLIIVDAFSNVKRVKSVIATIEKNLDAPSKCSKSEAAAKS